MGRITIGILRVVIALSLLGSLFVQVVMVPLFWADLDGAPLAPRIAVTTIVVLGIVTLQVSAVCIWMLLTMVRRGSVFSPGAFRHVDVMIGAVAAASVLAFAMAAVLAPTEIAPGVVALVGGAGVVIAGVALVIVVMRTLLRQAMNREAEAARLRSELDEVI